jgi:hypothetical protein
MRDNLKVQHVTHPLTHRKLSLCHIQFHSNSNSKFTHLNEQVVKIVTDFDRIWACYT